MGICAVVLHSVDNIYEILVYMKHIWCNDVVA